MCNGFDGWEPRNDQKTEEGCILGTTTYCLHHHYQHNYEYIMIVMVFVLENDHYCDAQGGEWKPPTNCGVEERGRGSSSREPWRHSHHLQSYKAYGKRELSVTIDLRQLYSSSNELIIFVRDSTHVLLIKSNQI